MTYSRRSRGALYSGNQEPVAAGLWIHAALGLIILAVYIFVLNNADSIAPELERIISATSVRLGGTCSASGVFFILFFPVITAGLFIWPLFRHILSFRLGLLGHPKLPDFMFYLLGYVAFGYSTIIGLALF